MKHISVIVPSGSVVIDTVIASYNLLRMANSYYKKMNNLKDDYYAIDLVGLSREPVQYQGLFQITPTKTIKEIESTDLIIITAISGDLEEGIERNTEFIKWIKEQRIENDAELASLCKGAFLLAETGLLNGKSCATHWTAHDLFQAEVSTGKTNSRKDYQRRQWDILQWWGLFFSQLHALSKLKRSSVEKQPLGVRKFRKSISIEWIKVSS